MNNEVTWMSAAGLGFQVSTGNFCGWVMYEPWEMALYSVGTMIDEALGLP